MFGTYVRKGELIVYPFFEYYRDKDFEYKPEEFGFVGDLDYRGRYRASEGLLFLGYGLTENLAFELEAAVIDASLEKSPDDRSSLPAKIQESGLGDVEAQLRWRWRKENERRPELFSYFEAVFPHNKDKLLIGTPGWEFKLGTGLVRGPELGRGPSPGALRVADLSVARARHRRRPFLRSASPGRGARRDVPEDAVGSSRGRPRRNRPHRPFRLLQRDPS
jgi:hypothetical protein